jgi:hypothetical protein
MSKKQSLRDKLESAEHALVQGAEGVLYATEDWIDEKWHHKLHRKVRHHVHRLRQKPEHHKKAIAFSIAFGVTLVVFVLWYLFTIPRIMGEYRVIRDQNIRLDNNTNPITELQERYDAKKNAASATGAIEVE